MPQTGYANRKTGYTGYIKPFKINAVTRVTCVTRIYAHGRISMESLFPRVSESTGYTGYAGYSVEIARFCVTPRNPCDGLRVTGYGLRQSPPAALAAPAMRRAAPPAAGKTGHFWTFFDRTSEEGKR